MSLLSKGYEHFADYCSLIKKNITHMMLWAYFLWVAGTFFQFGILTGQPITLTSVITFFGTILGLACVIAIANCRAINGWLGLISAFCLMYVAYTSKNYLTIGEQAAYIITLDIPVIISTNWNKGLAANVKTFGLKEWIIALVSTAIVWAGSSYGIIALNAYLTNPDPRPVVDGLVFAVSLTAGIITALGYNNNFIWWTFVGVFQLALWFITFFQHDASIAMFISSLFYLANDGLAFTYSPWFNKHIRARVAKKDKELFN